MSYSDDQYSQFSRRRLLEQILQSGAVVSLAQVSFVSELLASSLLNGLVKQAIAEETVGEVPLNYLNIGMLGAPMRYQFDHWLRTRATDPQLVPNSITGTKYKISTNGKVVGTELGYFEHNGVLVPNLFSQTAQLSSGSFSFSEILKHMVVIRGFGSGLDGHPTNFIRQHSPLGGASSIAALAAESGNRTFDVIQWPNRQGWSNYFSKNSKTINVLTGNDPAGTLLSGFGPPGANHATARTVAGRNQAAIDLAKSRLAFYIKSEAPGSKTLAKNHKGAVELIKRGVENFTDYWVPAVARYQSAIDQAIRKIGIEGISHAPLQFDEAAPWEGHHKEISENRKYLWTIGAGAHVFLKGDWDLRTAVENATMPTLATGLAIAEYIFREKLGTSIEIQSGPLQNLKIQPATGDVVNGFQLDHDMHTTGAAVAPFVMNQYYRAILAGISEFSSQLKLVQENDKNVWSKTVVHIVSDFERSARSDGAGSDHGFNQMVQSVIGGHITDGPHVVGNVKLNTANVHYGGSQGIAAPIAGYNQSGPPTQTMAASTVASLLKVAHNPYENVADSLCEIENEKVKIKYPSKIVEDT